MPRAFTLLEVLVALTLTAVVLSVGAQMAISGLRCEQHAAAIAAAMDRESMLEDVLRDDLTSLLVLDEEPCLRLTVGVPQQLELATAVVMEDEESWTSPHPARVTYRLSRDNPESSSRLVRQCVDLTRPQKPPIKETLAEGIGSWQVTVWHEGRWAPTPDKQGTPRLIRIEVQWVDGKAMSVILPVCVEGA
ncbi:MAG: prepilin-type N-terminal cleavage/methylation domain-containing protein [Phycisphaerales bacterium]|nr:prepilin-type N-terminal cleavage/methylation domain-containing protein [Phycisphaerales bacterium]